MDDDRRMTIFPVMMGQELIKRLNKFADQKRRSALIREAAEEILERAERQQKDAVHAA